MNKNLVTTQRQAYQGAKTFFNCYLPLIILLTSLLNIIDSAYLVILSIAVIVTYLIARVYYNKCNQIDTYLSGNTIFECDSEIINMNKADNQNMKQDNSAQMKEENKNSVDFKQMEDIVQEKINDQRRPEKYYCKICKLLVPYRGRHCYKCQRCVIRYDHHCFWIGNCVGANNHRQFFTFLFFQTINNILSEESIRYLLNHNHNYEIQNKYLSISYSLFWYSNWIMSIGFICFTLYLFLYHSMLIVTGMTTWQHLRRDKISYLKYLPAGYNPFSKGCLQNIFNFFAKQQEEYQIPTFDEAKNIKPSFNILNNQYYSCC